MSRSHRHPCLALFFLSPPLQAAAPDRAEPVIGLSADARRIIANADGAFAIIEEPGSRSKPVRDDSPVSSPRRQAVGLGNTISIDAALFGNALSGGPAR